MIISSIDETEWAKAVGMLREEYDIREGSRRDETAARRIAILAGELYLGLVRGRDRLERIMLDVVIIEKDIFDLAMENRLRCDPLKKETKSQHQGQVLSTWSRDKKSGLEGYSSQIKGWTAKAFLEKIQTTEKEEKHGTKHRGNGEGPVDLGVGALEDPRLEEAGVGPA